MRFATRGFHRDYRRNFRGKPWDRGFKQWMADIADGSCEEEYAGQREDAAQWWHNKGKVSP